MTRNKVAVKQTGMKSHFATVLFGLPPSQSRADEIPPQNVAKAVPPAIGDTKAMEKVRELLHLVGVDHAVSLIREEAGQGAASRFYDVSRDPDIYDLVEEEHLPDMGREVVRLIGLPRAIDLFRTLGGVDFPVPKGANNNRFGAMRFEMLSECVGVEAAEVLCAEFGSTRLYIPKCQQALQHIRDRRIVREFDAGASSEELALKFRLTHRGIDAILKKFS